MGRALRAGAGAWAFEDLPVAVTVTDRRGRVLSVNREARRLSGVGKGGGRNCCAYWGCRLSPSHCPLRRVLATGKTVYHAVVPTDGPRGRRTMIERVSAVSLPGRGRGAAIVTGQATAFLRRLKRLRFEAGTDPLTGVLSRRRFDALTARVAGRERRGRSSAFIMMDVDGLKAVNDGLGHAAGDRLLRRLGLVLRENTRRADLAGRVGGDEFAVYCPGAARARAESLVRRLRRAIAAENAAEPHEPVLSVQFGLACGRGGGGGLRARADARLCRRKRENSLRRADARRS